VEEETSLSTKSSDVVKPVSELLSCNNSKDGKLDDAIIINAETSKAKQFDGFALLEQKISFRHVNDAMITSSVARSTGNKPISTTDSSNNNSCKRGTSSLNLSSGLHELADHRKRAKSNKSRIDFYLRIGVSGLLCFFRQLSSVNTLCLFLTY